MGAGGNVHLAEQITISHSVERRIFKLDNFKFNGLLLLMPQSTVTYSFLFRGLGTLRRSPFGVPSVRIVVAKRRFSPKDRSRDGYSAGIVCKHCQQ